MTTQHTHPEFGDVDSQDVVAQHASDMQQTTDESTPTTTSEQAEQSSQFNQAEDIVTSTGSASVNLTIPTLLSFAIPAVSPSSSTAHDEVANDNAQVSQVSDDVAQTTEEASEQAEPVSVADVNATSDGIESGESATSETGTPQEVEIQASDISPVMVDEVLPLEPAP
ncbi:MAG TPA: hypothetical protein DHW02_22100, partial [Ktedonobacter sp.]|nr:hypothetical protein [Ktedonobacter sp.]